MTAVSNFLSMPTILKFIVVLGLVSPVVAYLSVTSGFIYSREVGSGSYGAAKTGLELIFVVAACLPFLYGSLKVVDKIAAGRVLCVFGWIALSYSPLMLEVVRDQAGTFSAEWLFNAVVSVLMIGYFYRSQGVNEYFGVSQER